MKSAGRADRVYGGLSADERRATRRRALLDAALDLFTEGGATAVSKRAVCARAKLNERYFHEHFANADAVLEAFIHEVAADVLDVIATASADAGPDLADQAKAVARAALEFLAEDPRRGALLLGSYSSDVVQRSKREAITAISKIVANQFDDRSASGADADATELATYAIVSGAMELIADWLRGDLDTSAERCADLIGGLLLAAPRIASTMPTPSGTGRSSRGGRR